MNTVVISDLQSSAMASSVVLAVTLTCLASCGGNGSMDPGVKGQSTGYAYVASAAAPNELMPGTVLQYAIDSRGSLTPLNIASVPAGSIPIAMISDPTGHYVYVLNEGDATISQYSVGPGGVLSALSPATVSVGAPFPSVAAYSLSVDPVGHALYVVMTPRDPAIPLITSIAQYAIGNGGTLSPLSPAVVDVSTMAGGPLAVDPSGAYAYLPGEPGVGEAVAAVGEVLQFSVAGNGALTLSTSIPLTVSRNPVRVTISPSGQIAYVLSTCMDDACDGQIAEYSIGGNGALTATGANMLTSPHVVPLSLLTDTAESGAYLLTNLMGVDTNAGAIYQYAINSTGALVPDSPSALSVSSGSVTQGILGPNLYALSSNVVGFASGAPTGGHIDHYSIGTGGLLTTVDTIAVTSGYPLAMAVVAAP